MEAVKIKIIEDEVAFNALREEWNRLLLASSASSVFLTHEWLSAYWSFFGNGRRLLILTAYGPAGGLIGAAPLCVREVSFLAVPVLRRAEFVGAPFSDILGIIIKPQEEARVVEAFLNALRLRGIDQLDLQENPEASTARGAMMAFRKKPGFQITEEEMGALPYLSTTIGWEEYLGSLGKSTQRNFKYYTNKLSKKFQLEYAAHKSPEAIDKEIGSFFALYEKRFKEYPSLVDPSHRRFREKIAPLFAKNGWMVLFTMKLNGVLAAAEWCFSWEGKLLSYNACYDPEWSKEGIATVFQGNIIRHAIQNGFREYDFLRGEEGYKGHWTTLKRVHFRLGIKRPSLKLSLLDLARRVRNGARDTRRQYRPTIVKTEEGLR
jgi:CelD/BcsL family acetyltransferase involved in cellulose biosynthesis